MRALKQFNNSKHTIEWNVKNDDSIVKITHTHTYTYNDTHQRLYNYV